MNVTKRWKHHTKMVNNKCRIIVGTARKGEKIRVTVH